MTAAAGTPTLDEGRAVLAGVEAGLRRLHELAYASLPGDDLLELARATERVARLVFAVQVAQADEVDQRGLAAAQACPSTAALLRQALRIPAHEARFRVRCARAVHAQDLPSGGSTPPRLPLLRAALDEGLLDRSHVDTVIGTVRDLPEAVADEVVVEAEQQLVAYATYLEPDQFRRVAAHLAEVLDPDGTPDQEAAAARAEFTIGVRNAGTGLTPISGRLDDLSVETLRSALDGLAAPRPATGGAPDPRPPAVRRAHALMEVVRRAVRHVDLPGHGGRAPQVTVTVPWDLAARTLGTAVTDHGVTLGPATVRRLLCDAEVIPAVLGSEGQVLDLGRSTRTFSRAVRHAISVRDRGCSFPGCDRPPSWTDVHHLRFWHRDLGPTSVDNGCLLCPYHHSEIHREQWRARMSADGVPEFVPPRWIDPAQRPRRNTLHHLAPTAEPP